MPRFFRGFVTAILRRNRKGERVRVAGREGNQDRSWRLGQFPRTPTCRSGSFFYERSAHVVDGILQEHGHALPGGLRRSSFDRLQDGAVLLETIVLNAGVAPAELESADEGGVDQSAKSTDEQVPRRIENALMKPKVGAGEVATARLPALHVEIGGVDTLERLGIVALSGQVGRLRLNHLS